MSWDMSESAEFFNMLHAGVGQVTPDSDLGVFLQKVASDTQYTRYLEIGTWNGLGSTRCFKMGFELRDDYTFISLETNEDKCELARARYLDSPRIQILHATVLKPADVPAGPELEKIFGYYKNEWHSTDMENLAAAAYLFDTVPNEFDVVFLDGGEFTTYFEFKVVEPHCRLLICDDTSQAKCKKVREELLANPKWRCIVDRPDDRNGWCAFSKI